MADILKMVDVYVRQLPKKEILGDKWYFDQLDLILDELFEEAVDQGYESWTDLCRATQAVDGKGLCYSTIVNLGERWTKRPQLRTVLIIAAALGKSVVLKGTSKKPKLSVVSMAS